MKYCSQCGAQMTDEARFCPKCGTASEPQLQQHQYEQPTPQPHYQQSPQQPYRQPYSAPKRPVKVDKGPNPVEQAVVNFADRYCGPQSLGWALALCIAALLLLIFYNGYMLNFRGVLLDITDKITDTLPLWVVVDIMQLSLLYMFMHLVNALYKAGGTWPLLYITPCIWLLTMVLFSVLCLTQNGSYDDLSNIQSLLLASYVCVGIVGILCSKIEAFSWTGKVIIIAAICWIVFEVSQSMITFIFSALGSIWYMFEINSRTRHFFNDYLYESYDETYQDDNVYAEE